MHFLHNKFDCLEKERLIMTLTAVYKDGAEAWPKTSTS